MANENLYLEDIFIHVYQPKLVCAYIYYGEKDHPRDHNGKEMGAFYQEEFELKDHLEKNVLPLLKKNFTSSYYNLMDELELLQGHAPYFTLSRADKKEMTQKDVVNIQKLLDKALIAMRKPEKELKIEPPSIEKPERRKVKQPTLFAPPTKDLQKRFEKVKQENKTKSQPNK